MNNSNYSSNLIPTTKPPTIPPYFYRSQATIIAQVTSLAILGIITLLGNLASIVTFAKTQSLRKRSNYMIINLSVADCFESMTIFLGCYYFVFQAFQQPVLLQKVADVSDSLTGTASLLALTMISVERFYAVVFPFKHRRLRFKHYFIMCLIPWIVSAIVFLIHAGSGFSLQRGKLTMPVFFSYLIMLLSLIVIIVSYLGIFLKSRQINPTAQIQNRAMRDKKLSVRLFIVTLASLSTWLPIQSFLFVLFFSQTLSFQYNYFLLTKFLQFSNSAINFFIYILRMRDFRARFLAIFCCKREISMNALPTNISSISARDLAPSLTFTKQKTYAVSNDVTIAEEGLETSG